MILAEMNTILDRLGTLTSYKFEKKHVDAFLPFAEAMDFNKISAMLKFHEDNRGNPSWWDLVDRYKWDLITNKNHTCECCKNEGLIRGLNPFDNRSYIFNCFCHVGRLTPPRTGRWDNKYLSIGWQKIGFMDQIPTIKGI